MRRALATLVLSVVLLPVAGCDDGATCPPDDSFVVEERGTCAAAPTRFTLVTQACRVRLQDATSDVTGLPATGAMSQRPQPLRQGGFILYTADPAPFRLCRATRVEFRLELACVDAQGAPACDATLTEPGP